MLSLKIGTVCSDSNYQCSQVTNMLRTGQMSRVQLPVQTENSSARTGDTSHSLFLLLEVESSLLHLQLGLFGKDFI